MTGPLPKLYSAELDGDFVVFLVGMRVRRPWKLHKVLWMQRAMGRMMAELRTDRDLGLLHTEGYSGFADFMMVQYWRSFEHLDRYANDPNLAHAPAWRDFTRKVGYDGDIGIWHETYLVENQRYETLYGAMPAFGLARAGRVCPLTDANRFAAQRVNPSGQSSRPT
ncbi:MAG: DUF4188 domain-containing protein [Alphaproteobacteria bacterium]|nr:DUF4188 domain-containing protein [Alphaproteobacteria bacterium]